VTRTARDLEVKFRHLRNRPDGFEYFSTGRLRYATPWPADQLVGDVLMLHWIGKLVDYPSFFGSLPADRPIVWVLHDMNPFTGGCHFSAGCNRFMQHCGNCPQIASSSDRDITFQTLRMKRRLYEGLNLHVVSPSRWLSEQAKRSVPLAGAASQHVIPYGLETDRFAPADRREARNALGLDPGKTIVLFGAASSDNRRKGFQLLMEAWSRLPSEQIQGVMFGAGEAPTVEAGQADIQHLGFIRDPDRLRLVYSAADLFVLPSLEDNLPQTGMEAMSCGTPVVAFAAGGIPDYVRPGETGELVPVGDSRCLAQTISRLVDDPQSRRRMGDNGRKMMLLEYSQPIESARYMELLQSLRSWRRQGSAAA
jgi:glycosyltransferase involved in cell wall biosynthesis